MADGIRVLEDFPNLYPSTIAKRDLRCRLNLMGQGLVCYCC